MVIRTYLKQNFVMMFILILFSIKISYVFLLFLIKVIANIIFNKIEFDGNNIIIKYIFGNTLININNIESMKIVTYYPFSIKKNISKINWQNRIIIYYLSSNNKKKKETFDIINCPGFEKIIQKILQIKPNLKIIYNRSEY